MEKLKKTDFEFVHDELYGTALEVSKKFISRNDMRPVLNYALHSDDGSIYATDSHRLIHIKDIHGFKEEFLVSPKTLMFAKGKYPEINQLIEIDNHEKSISLNKQQIKLWLQVLKSINQMIRVMKDYSKVARFNFEDDSLSVEIPSQKVVMQLPTDQYEKIQDLNNISFNPEYLRDALEAHFKLNSEELSIYFRGSMRPFALDDGKRVKTIILPVRTSY